MPASNFSDFTRNYSCYRILGCNGGNGEKRKWKPKRFSLCGNGNGKGGVVETEGLFLGLIGFPAFDASPDKGENRAQSSRTPKGMAHDLS